MGNVGDTVTDSFNQLTRLIRSRSSTDYSASSLRFLLAPTLALGVWSFGSKFPRRASVLFFLARANLADEKEESEGQER